MIHANTKIGIVYCDNSKVYVKELEQIINEYKSKGYCIEPVIIDKDFVDSERSIEKRVFNNLDKCDYAYIFLTKDISISNSSFFISKPNVILELGFFIKNIDKNNIFLIIDFPFKDIQSSYMLPSDIPGEVLEIIDKNNSLSGLKKLFKRFIEVNENNIICLEDYDANDLISSLLLNENYRTNYENLFSKQQCKIIEKYSIKWQLDEIIDIWLEEKSTLSVIEQIMYLFERIVFLPFFPGESLKEKINDLLLIHIRKSNTYISSCMALLNSIIEYEDYKGQRLQHESAEFYYNIAKEIENELEKVKEQNLAPIIECICKNYIGLCYLNAFFCKNKENSENIENYFPFLNVAKGNFADVIELSKNKLMDSRGVFEAFAQYNIARVYRNLGESAEKAYFSAIQKRDGLSKALCFPEIFRLNFALEKIHAELDHNDYRFQKGQITDIEYRNVLNKLNEKLQYIKTTPVLNVSLFKTLEKKLDNKLKTSLI